MTTLTYPGVYLEELPSGVHAIKGVATSIGAFVGWAPQGPTTVAKKVNSWSDYQAIFGGLDSRSTLGYAVNQFFANGGQQAYIVRLIWDGSLPAAPGTHPDVAATALVAGVGYATTQIIATSGAIASPPVGVSIGPPVLQGIAIGPVGLAPIPLGATITFVATGSLTDASSAPLAGVAWSSSDPAVLTITAGGVATAVGAGSTTLTATLATAFGTLTGTLGVTVTAATLTSIVITPPGPVTLPAGQPAPPAGQPQIGPSQQLSALGNYSNGTSLDLSRTVAWSSSDSTKASVDATGLVTASSVTGTATIMAAWAGSSATINFTVVAATVSTIVIHPGAAVVAPTQTVNYTATGIFSDGTSGALAGPEVWTSSNASVASINSATGVATGVAAGSTTISIASDGRTASATLTVTTATLNAISIVPANPTVAVGLVLPLKALGIFSDGTTADLTTSAAWTSATPASAGVDANTGRVTGKAVAASVAITAAWQGVSQAVNVAVTAPVLQRLAITPTPVNIVSGGTAQLTATGTFSDGTTKDLSGTAAWSSASPAIVSVNATGLATAVAAGGSLSLFAANPGKWGNTLRVGVTTNPTDATRFGLLVQQQTTPGGALRTLESFVNLSTKPTDANFVVTVIDNDSNYLTFIPPGSSAPIVPTSAPSATPSGSPVALSGGADGAALAPSTDQNFELALTSSATAGYQLLDRVDIFNLLCVPGENDVPTISTLQQYCAVRRAFYIVDPAKTATTSALTQTGPVGITAGPKAANSALYFPWITAPDPLFGNRLTLFPPCGAVAGIYAATDASRGVWKAPAGVQAALTGVNGLQYNLTDLENGDLNVQAVNCLREFKVYGDVVWGARTLSGNDQAGSEWKYVPIRRLALYIESSLFEGTQWVVFEPNDAPLWGQIRLNVGAFMQGLFLQGAFQGASPSQAYFVKCDSENNPQASIDLGVVNILVGFAPLFPAEFVVVQIQQMAGQVS